MRGRHFDLLTDNNDTSTHECMKTITSVTKQLKNYQVS